MVTLHLGPVKVTLSFILSQIPGSPITIFEVQIWAVIFNQNILQILDLQKRSWKKLQYEFPKMRGVQRPFGTFPKFIRFGSATRPWGKCGRGWCFINLYLLFHKCAILMYTFQHLARVKVFYQCTPPVVIICHYLLVIFQFSQTLQKNYYPPPLWKTNPQHP